MINGQSKKTDPSQYKNKVIINQQAYYTDSIKINQVNSNVIIQNRQKEQKHTGSRPMTQLGVPNLTQLVNKMAN
jgi:hypothetical protein